MSGYDRVPQNPFSAPESDLAPERYASDVGPITYATFWQRFAAAFLDGIIVAVLGTSISYVMDRMTDEFDVISGSNSVLLLRGGLPWGIWWLYYALQESSAAQATLGKRAIGLRVTGLEGRQISFGRATGRFFAKMLFPFFVGMVLAILLMSIIEPGLAVIASILCPLLGFLMQPFTARKQALHDIMAGTLVLKG